MRRLDAGQRTGLLLIVIGLVLIFVDGAIKGPNWIGPAAGGFIVGGMLNLRRRRDR